MILWFNQPNIAQRLTLKSNNMATLLFTPKTTIDANVFQHRLDQSPFHAEWNIRTGAYEFQEEQENIEELEEIITNSLAFDIDGRFELEN